MTSVSKIASAQPPKLEDKDRWFDWSRAVTVEDGYIQEMIDEAVEGVKKYILEGEERADFEISTGDTVVRASVYRGSSSIDVKVMTPRLSTRVYFREDDVP